MSYFTAHLKLFQAQKSCERADADLKNVENILSSVGITDVDTDAGVDGLLLKKVQKNIDMLHGKSEELTSRNLSLKVEIDKLKNTGNTTQV